MFEDQDSFQDNLGELSTVGGAWDQPHMLILAT